MARFETEHEYLAGCVENNITQLYERIDPTLNRFWYRSESGELVVSSGLWMRRSDCHYPGRNYRHRGVAFILSVDCTTSIMGVYSDGVLDLHFGPRSQIYDVKPQGNLCYYSSNGRGSGMQVFDDEGIRAFTDRVGIDGVSRFEQLTEELLEVVPGPSQASE